MSKVFYVPGHSAIIDYARELVPGAWIAQHSGLMLPEIHVSYPGAILGDEEDFLIDQERAFGTAPTQTTCTRFDFAFSQRQILDYAGDTLGESFKLADLDVGNMTTVFARWGGRCWSFKGLATLPHRLIMRRVALHVLASEKA